MLNIGDNAPAFPSLNEYEGQWILLYFYPKDDTPGCTKEACGFRDHFDALSQTMVILGVSKDDTTSHEQFSKKYDLPFTLLADPDRAIIMAYGADGETYPKRVSFLIGPDGIIKKIYAKVECETHAEEVLRDVAAFG